MPDAQVGSTPPRTLEQRVADARARLAGDVDAWVATADPGRGVPHLVPLSYLWDGGTLLVSTPAASPTARNLQATGAVRVGLGPTRDVVMVEGTVTWEEAAAIPSDVGDAFAARTGFDPRRSAERYLWFHIRPRRVQAWREADELAGRELMRDGTWLAP
jgi:hypothetical protein